jgi:plasmid stability protein
MQSLTSLLSLPTQYHRHPGKQMTSLTIRNIDMFVKDRLRIRAARNRRSLEAELRAIITEAATAEPPRELNLAEAIRRRMLPLGGIDDLPPHPATEPGAPLTFGP